MGVYLRHELASLGHEVIVTSRKARTDEDNIRFVKGNGKEVVFVKSIIETEHPDVIVDFMVYSTREFAEKVDLLISNVTQYIFLSSYRVFNEEVPLRENSPRLLDSIKDAAYLSTDEYGLCKARCEDILRDSGRCNWTIVRPCITYSKARFQFGCLEAETVCYRALRGLPVVVPNEIYSKKTTMTWGGDVAKMIARLVLNEKAYGEDFNVVTSESHTWAEVGDLYNKIIGMKVKIVPLSDYLSICGEYQVRYDRMFNRVLDNKKIIETTGVRQEGLMSLNEGLEMELRSNIEALKLLKPNIYQNALIDKMCGIVALPEGSIKLKIDYLAARYRFFGVILRILRRIKRIILK